MNIIICGAGKVGFSISKQLTAQGHSVTVIDQSSEDIKKISWESSSKERLSEEATRDAKKTMKCKLALEKINQVFKGYISGITNFGIFIHLTDLGIEGLCHIKRLPGNEYYLFNENSKSLVGKNSGNSYFLGNTISAKIKSVDIISHRIDLEIKK